jgi:hypothetical protein
MKRLAPFFAAILIIIAGCSGGGSDHSNTVTTSPVASPPAIADAFPMLKAIVWFSNFTFDSETGLNIDWTLTSNPEVNDHYRQVVAGPLLYQSSLIGTFAMTSINSIIGGGLTKALSIRQPCAWAIN